jgi:CheY-like chemotaxis protein
MESPKPISKTILVTEDEQVLRESVAELLTDEGYDVLQAANGKEAHDQLLQRPVDLILSDIRMPEMDGTQLLTHARQIAPQFTATNGLSRVIPL